MDDSSSVSNLDASMALLSPPSSRYAFEPALHTSAIPPISNLDETRTGPAPLLSGSSSVNTANSTSQGELPALEPKTQQLLSSFTAELGSFTSWLKALPADQQRTVLDCVLETVDSEVVEYVRDKVNAKNSTSDFGRFSPPLSAATMRSPARPVSPLLMMNGESEPLFSPRAHAGNALGNGFGGLSSALGSQYGSQYGSQVGSPPIGSPVMSSLALLDPVARPHSAGPLYSNLAAPVRIGSRNGPGTGALSPRYASPPRDSFLAGSPSSQPLARVFSSDLERRRPDFFEDVGLTSASEFSQNAMLLNHSLNSITKRGQSQQASPRRDNWSLDRSLDRPGRAERADRSRDTLTVPTLGPYAAAARGSSVPPTRRNHVTPASPPPQAPPSLNISPPSVVKSATPQDIASRHLLENIPLWLKTLRLHKYTDNLRTLDWRKMVELDDTQLEQLGVTTVGARNKLLKSFAYVKENLHE